MLVKYDWADMPLDTPMSFAGMLIYNGRPFEIDPEQFKKKTGKSVTEAVRINHNLTIVRKKVN